MSANPSMPAPTSSRRKLLVLMPTAEEHLAQFRQRYDVIYAPTAEAWRWVSGSPWATMSWVITV